MPIPVSFISILQYWGLLKAVILTEPISGVYLSALDIRFLKIESIFVLSNQTLRKRKLLSKVNCICLASANDLNCCIISSMKEYNSYSAIRNFMVESLVFSKLIRLFIILKRLFVLRMAVSRLASPSGDSFSFSRISFRGALTRVNGVRMSCAALMKNETFSEDISFSFFIKK